MVIIMIYFICTSNQSGKFQVKDMNVYIEPLIDELLKLWNGITMYGILDQYRKGNFNSMQWLHGQYTMPLGQPNFVVCIFKLHFNCI